MKGTMAHFTLPIYFTSWPQQDLAITKTSLYPTP